MSEYEKRVLAFESARNESMDEWFNARPQFEKRRAAIAAFEGGFRMSWEHQQARIEALKKAFNELEASAIGPVTRMRGDGSITVGYKEFCALAALLEASDEPE